MKAREPADAVTDTLSRRVRPRLGCDAQPMVADVRRIANKSGTAANFRQLQLRVVALDNPHPRSLQHGKHGPGHEGGHGITIHSHGLDSGLAAQDLGQKTARACPGINDAGRLLIQRPVHHRANQLTWRVNSAIGAPSRGIAQPAERRAQRVFARLDGRTSPGDLAWARLRPAREGTGQSALIREERAACSCRTKSERQADQRTFGIDHLCGRTSRSPCRAGTASRRRPGCTGLLTAPASSPHRPPHCTGLLTAPASSPHRPPRSHVTAPVTMELNPTLKRHGGSVW